MIKRLLSFFVSVTIVHECRGLRPKLSVARAVTRSRMRVNVVYGDLSVLPASQVAALQTTVVPEAVSFWTRAIRLVPRRSPILAKRACDYYVGGVCVQAAIVNLCNGGHIPADLLDELDVFSCPPGRSCTRSHRLPRGRGVPDADLVLLISASASTDCASFIAYAQTCQLDQAGRPIIAGVTVCRQLFAHTHSEQVTTLIHEITHGLGFVGRVSDWKRPDGSFRLPAPAPSVRYSCRRMGDSVYAHFTSIPKPFETLHDFTYPTGIIESLDIRGFGEGSTCRCPMDPARKYNDGDLNDCLNNRANCALAIVTPKVREAAREYFDCATLQGMELENTVRPECSIINPHWKSRLIRGEIMTANISAHGGFISPITFALLEDTGWYHLDYSLTTRLIPGLFWGYKDGCDFVKKKCINPSSSVPVVPLHSHPIFCNTHRATACAHDALSVVTCRTPTGDSRLVTPLEQYQYPVSGVEPAFDFCPVYRNSESCSTVEGRPSRCLMERVSGSSAGTPDKLSPACRDVHCVGEGMEYEVWVDGRSIGECRRKGELIKYRRTSDMATVVCQDPAIICAQYHYPHIPRDPINLLPKQLAVAADSKPSGIWNEPRKRARVFSGFPEIV